MDRRMKILIAYDGSACADAALDDLHQAGLPRETEALVVSVAEVWLPPPPPSSFEIVEAARAVHVPADLKQVYVQKTPAVEEAQALAERAKERLQSTFPEWKVCAEASYGSPAWELITRADQWKPDLIVVGSHGRSRLGRLILGSVSQKVVTESRCSVRVARGRVEEPGSPVRIVIGVDGSPAAEAAVREVAARTWPLNSEARVVLVDDPLTPTIIGHLIPQVGEAVEASNKEEEVWARKLVEDAARVLSSSELKVSTVIEVGDPKRVLVEQAKAWGADSIFVGSLGSGHGFARFLLGSVSSAVVARAHCSVEVVRTERTPAE